MTMEPTQVQQAEFKKALDDLGWYDAKFVGGNEYCEDATRSEDNHMEDE